jgi:hypothetical protein
MKKTYMTPIMEVLEMDAMTLLAGSVNIKSDDPEIGFGGIDNEGNFDPAAPSF